jgi:hypothetical protein
MREIKFRAWDKNDHKMKGVILFGNLYLWTNDIWMDMANPKLIENAHEIGNTCELMQFTGLKDKNGKECYWDDLVSDGINLPFLVTPDYHLLARLSEIEFEVIGNIYENPGLLDEKN